MKAHRERDLTQKAKNSRAAWLEKPCEICGKKRGFHTTKEAHDCQGAVANDSEVWGGSF